MPTIDPCAEAATGMASDIRNVMAFTHLTKASLQVEVTDASR
jgi:hypothetical protein